MSFKCSLLGLKGHMKMVKGKDAEAEKYLSEAYDLGMTSSTYLFSYGTLLMRKHDYQKCLEVYERAFDNTSESMPYIDVIRCSIITCHYKLGLEEQALKEIEELYNSGARNSTIYMVYGYLLMHAGRYDDALKINLEGLDYDENDIAVMDTLGQTYYRMGDIENAKKYFNMAIEIKYNIVDSCYFMALICMDEGKLLKAKDYLTDIIDAPFSALTTVTREEIQTKLKEVKLALNE